MDEWVGVREGLVSCWVKQGLPAAVAEEMFRRSPDLIRHDGSETRWIYVSDYQLVAHRIGDEYYFRRDDFTRLLDLIVPNTELIALFASGAEFVWED